MKRLLLVCTTLLAALTTFGQSLGGNHNDDVEPANAGFGVKGGLNVAYMYGSGLDREELIGFHAGIFGRFGLTEKTALQLEALYSRKGLKKATSDGIQLGKTDNGPYLRLDYIDVPLLFYYNVFRNLSVYAGPQVSLMLTAKSNDEEIKKDGLHTFDFGGAGGLEGRFGFFTVGARYNIGLQELINKDESISADQNLAALANQELKNAVVQAYVGFAFR